MNIYLYGNPELDEYENKLLLRATIKFITDSNQFKMNCLPNTLFRCNSLTEIVINQVYPFKITFKFSLTQTTGLKQRELFFLSSSVPNMFTIMLESLCIS